MDEVVAGYRLIGPLGEGGGGRVWEARAPGPEARVVAVKRVSAGGGTEAADALRREAEIVADLDHPHVLPITAVVDDPPGIALVMPLARGGSLRDLLDDRGSLLAGEVVAVLAPVADALASAHRHGVVHGDVKPSNVLLTSGGEALLADFGIARLLGQPIAPGLQLTGTAGYLDPACRPGQPPGAGSDVFALAVVAYEALAGRRPHKGTAAEAQAAAEAGLHRPLAEIASIPPRLAVAVDEVLAGPSADGIRSAEAFAAALRAGVDPASVQRPGPAAVRPSPERSGSGVVDGTRAFGPRPPEARGVGRPTLLGRRAALGLLAVALAAVSSVAGISAFASGPRAAGARDSQPLRRGASGTSANGHRRLTHCPRVVVPGTGADGPIRRADLDGDGCAEAVRWDGRVLSVLGRGRGRVERYQLGAPGDQLLLGDWDCRDGASPALYRPATGEVLWIDRLGGEIGERQYADHVEQRAPGGTARAGRSRRGCDTVVVRSR